MPESFLKNRESPHIKTHYNYTKKFRIFQLLFLLKNLAILAQLCYNNNMDTKLKENLKFINDEVFCTYLRTNAPLNPNVYSSHIHNGYELLFFYDGDVDYIIGGSIYHLQKNDLLLIKPAVYHHARILLPHPYERIVIHFKDTSLLQELLPILESADDFYQIQAHSPIKRIFDNLRDCFGVFNKTEYHYLSRHSLNNILINLQYINEHTVKEKIHTNSTLENILLYIDENPTLPLTIASLSEKFNLSPSWIAHSFKKALGTSPSQYINHKKIMYAQSLINMGTSPVQAAEMCSYINYTTFYRQYKKYLGIKPTEDKPL